MHLTLAAVVAAVVLPPVRNRALHPAASDGRLTVRGHPFGTGHITECGSEQGWVVLFEGGVEICRDAFIRRLSGMPADAEYGTREPCRSR